MKCTINCIFASHLIWKDKNTRHIFCHRSLNYHPTTNDNCKFYDDLSDDIDKRVLGVEFLGDKPRKEWEI